MFIFGSQLFCLLLLFSAPTPTAQPYIATDYILLDCGSSSSTTTTTTDSDNRKWDGDDRSIFVSSYINTTSFSAKPSFLDASVPVIPYSTARIFNATSFTYAFPVSQGPKFLRLYFYPANYSDLKADQSFFSVSSNGYSLLTNFSAFLTASYVARTLSDKRPKSAPIHSIVKEFIIYVEDAQLLDVIFTPSPYSYAFINGIEIVSMPEKLYYGANHVLKYVGANDYDDKAQENIYRLNIGGVYISGANDTGMYRSWEEDENYIFPASVTWWTPVRTTPITYTTETPNYTAPEPVYQTQRSMGNQSLFHNLTWRLPVDSGYYYMIRLHFCNIIPQYTERDGVVFRIFIYNKTAEAKADVFSWSQGSGHPVVKDYVVFVNDEDGSRSKQNLWLAVQPNLHASETYADAFFNGLEAFKLSTDGSLSSPNPELSLALPQPPSHRTPPYPVIIGGVGGGLVLLTILVLIVLWRRRRVKHHYTADDKSSWDPNSIELNSTQSCPSSLSSARCRRFTLRELKAATSDFDENFIIGKGGFGKVYKGYMDKASTIVAIKRLNPLSNQGFHEFQTEINMLSKLRHVHLVSLIGYCDDNGEMVLVYDYMAHGTLQEHLYKTNNPPLSWKTRLNICMGAAQGLLYLHTAARRGIIHRDVKSTNILLDENWVAKVSDFGLSKLGPKHPSQTHVSTVVKGSIGYLDPEYYRRQQLTDKSDVYSFGVVLFEVMCARPVIIPWLPNEQVNLAEWGKHCYQKGTLDEIIDPKLRGEIAPASLRKFGEVANSCLKEQGSERPAMEDVVCGLEFALLLQESAGETVDEAVPENQKLSFLMDGEPTTITMDDNRVEDQGKRFIRRGPSTM